MKWRCYWYQNNILQYSLISKWADSFSNKNQCIHTVCMWNQCLSHIPQHLPMNYSGKSVTLSWRALISVKVAWATNITQRFIGPTTCCYFIGFQYCRWARLVILLLSKGHLSDFTDTCENSRKKWTTALEEKIILMMSFTTESKLEARSL